MKVLAVASEIFPVIKTGGLADVTGALPGALAPLGIEVRTLIPGYRGVLGQLVRPRTVHSFESLMGGPARIRATMVAGLPLLVLDAPHLFDRDGGPYNAPGGADWADNPQRFAALCQAGAAVARGALGAWRPDVVHAHDWQAGFVPAYLAYDGGAPVPSVFTVHNLAFQGFCGAEMLGPLGFPASSFTVDGIEFYGGISPLKAGLRLADRLTTVSPTYAAEITRPEDGQGLDGLLRSRADVLFGIANGIDTGVWDPSKDALLPHRFAGVAARQRGRNKAVLQAQFGLEVAPDALLFGIVSRLTGQKGMDIVAAAVPELLGLGAQLVVFGSGEPALEAGLLAAAAAHPGRVAVRIGYDEGVAHLIQAGVDALLVPSRFEPCGLTQLCALRYGAIPVVSRVGGLADTVIDANPAAMAAGVATGVQFLPVSSAGLGYALRRAAALWADKAAWTRLQRNAMRSDVSWAAPAAAYAALYRELVS
jgi:starch synthase